MTQGSPALRANLGLNDGIPLGFPNGGRQPEISDEAMNIQSPKQRVEFVNETRSHPWNIPKGLNHSSQRCRCNRLRWGTDRKWHQP